MGGLARQGTHWNCLAAMRAEQGEAAATTNSSRASSEHGELGGGKGEVGRSSRRARLAYEARGMAVGWGTLKDATRTVLAQWGYGGRRRCGSACGATQGSALKAQAWRIRDNGAAVWRAARCARRAWAGTATRRGREDQGVRVQCGHGGNVAQTRMA